MLNLKAATSKRWKEIEKRPVKRKTISTDMGKNTNKRFQKIIEKDAKKLRKLRDDGEGGGDEVEEPEEGDWQPADDDDEALGSDEEFGSDDEEINSDEC
jgi:hypothetical protein